MYHHSSLSYSPLYLISILPPNQIINTEQIRSLTHVAKQHYCRWPWQCLPTSYFFKYLWGQGSSSATTWQEWLWLSLQSSLIASSYFRLEVFILYGLWHKSLPLIVIKALYDDFSPSRLLSEVFQNYKPPFPRPALTRGNGGEQNFFCCRQTGFVCSLYFGFGFLHKIQQSFHVNAYRFEGNSFQWQPEAGQLWIWGAERKMFPLIETHTDSCIERHYRDTRGHWIQQRCCLSSTGRRWLLAGFTKIREQVVLLPPEKHSTPPCLAGCEVKTLSLKAQILQGVWCGKSLHQTNPWELPRSPKPHWSVRNDAQLLLRFSRRVQRGSWMTLATISEPAQKVAFF